MNENSILQIATINVNGNNYEVVESRAVAQVINKTHCELIKDIYTYGTNLYNNNVDTFEYFIFSNYTDKDNKKQPCFLITKKGCELIAKYLDKSIHDIFTVQYINIFSKEDLFLIDSIKFYNKDNILTVSSLEIAENFGKQHKHVLEAIEELKKGVAEKSADLFIESTYVHPQNKQTYKCYNLTRDGLSLLVMGFTGKKALEWKLKYIQAFNLMEAKLKEILSSQTQSVQPQTSKEDNLILSIVKSNSIPERALALNEYTELVKKPLLETINTQQEIIQEQQPKVEYHDEVLNKDDLMNISVIAKDLGITAKKLNNILHNNRVIFKQDSSWLVYAEYSWLIDEHYADYKSYNNDKYPPQLKWTEKGRKWIIKTFFNNTMPNMAFGKRSVY